MLMVYDEKADEAVQVVTELGDSGMLDKIMALDEVEQLGSIIGTITDMWCDEHKDYTTSEIFTVMAEIADKVDELAKKRGGNR